MLARLNTTPLNMVVAIREDQGKFLRMLRAANNWNMEEAAVAAGVSRQTWHAWEKNKTEMRMESLRSILKLWETTFDGVAA